MMQLACQHLLARLGLLALGDVARDLGRADDSALPVSHRRHRQGDCDKASILAAASGFIVVDAFAALDASENLGLLTLAFGRNDNRDRLAYDFLRPIPEQALRSLVPAGDDAVEVLAYDRIVGRLHDRGQMLGDL